MAGAEPTGKMRDERLHAIVARSTFRSQHVKKQHMFAPLLEAEMSKKCTPFWREAHFEVNMLKKQHMFAPLLEVERSKKCTPLWREAHVEVKMYKAPHVRAAFGGSDAVFRVRRKGLCTLAKKSKA